MIKYTFNIHPTYSRLSEWLAIDSRYIRYISALNLCWLTDSSSLPVVVVVWAKLRCLRSEKCLRVEGNSISSTIAPCDRGKLLCVCEIVYWCGFDSVYKRLSCTVKRAINISMGVKSCYIRFDLSDRVCTGRERLYIYAN